MLQPRPHQEKPSFQRHTILDARIFKNDNNLAAYEIKSSCATRLNMANSSLLPVAKHSTVNLITDIPREVLKLEGSMNGILIATMDVQVASLKLCPRLLLLDDQEQRLQGEIWESAMDAAGLNAFIW